MAQKSRQKNKSISKETKHPAPEIDPKQHILQVQQISASSFTGPFPPPEILAEYEKIIPSAADRILKMAEDQSDHRRTLETSVAKSDIKLAERGQIFAFIIALIAIIATVASAYLGSEISATVLGGATVATLVSLFIREGRLKHLRKKTKQLLDFPFYQKCLSKQ